VSLALLLIASGGCTGETEADKKTVEALSKLAATAADTKSLSADFTVTCRLKNGSLVASGKVKLCVPDKMSITVGSPIDQSFISDGNVVWCILAPSNAIARADLSKARKQATDPPSQLYVKEKSLGIPADLAEAGPIKLIRREEIQSVGCYVFETDGRKSWLGLLGRATWVAGIPGIQLAALKYMPVDDLQRIKATPPQRIRRKCFAFVAEQDGLLRRFVCTVGEFYTLTVDFTNVKLNPTLEPESFHYKPPAGTKVTDITDGVLDEHGIKLPKESSQPARQTWITK